MDFDYDGLIEKLYVQPKELFECVDFTDLGVIDEYEEQVPKFIEGENYSLKGVSCDGFDMEEKVYKLVKVVDEFCGTNINSVIVKQISGPQSTIFTLSKNDCAWHNIEFENGLQLFPKSLPWVRIKTKVEFDKHNLATTPLSNIDNTIRFVLFKLSGFQDYTDGYILTPSGHLIKEKKFARSLRVTSNEPIVYGNGFTAMYNQPLPIEIVHPNNLLFTHGNFISSEDSIFVLVKLIREHHNENFSFDGCFGVEPRYLEGINPNDFFKISWDEFGAYTIDEYEELKKKAEKEKEERIKRAEEANKRRIYEEKKRKEQAIPYLKAYNLKMPTFPRFTPSGLNRSISSVNMYVDGVNDYIGTLEKSLNMITESTNLLDYYYANRLYGGVKLDDNTEHLITYSY